MGKKPPTFGPKSATLTVNGKKIDSPNKLISKAFFNTIVFFDEKITSLRG